MMLDRGPNAMSDESRVAHERTALMRSLLFSHQRDSDDILRDRLMAIARLAHHDVNVRSPTGRAAYGKT